MQKRITNKIKLQSLNYQNQQPRIVLACDNIMRELSYLLLLKQHLEQECKAKVFIIGSVADLQRSFYLLNKIQPHVVILSQVVEDGMRNLAKYAKKSGSLVYILPPEILVIPALDRILANPAIGYNRLIDGIFLPGTRMKKLFLKTNIKENKLHVVGSPKIDFLIKASGSDFYSRKKFLKIISAPYSRKNIIIFTSFVRTPIEYLRKNKTFQRNIKRMSQNNQSVKKAQEMYLSMIERLCLDFPKLNIILKPHPRENSSIYKKISYPNFFIAKNTTFYNCLSSIDLAIHWSSTVSTECWLRNIPTIEYITDTDKKDSLIESWPGNPVVSSYIALKKAIIKYLNSPLEKKYLKFQKKYLIDNYFSFDGDSSIRIAHILNKALQKSFPCTLYSKKHSVLTDIFMIFEKIIGVYLTRRVVAIFIKRYDWQYSINNYLYLE